MTTATATDADRKLLAWINKPADQRYDTSVELRAQLLCRVWRWQERVKATQEDVDRVIDSLGLRSDEVFAAAMDM